MFFETKSIATMQGDIGVARSTDQGVSWEVLGIALDEEWHLSYPFVFKYNDQVSPTYPFPFGNFFLLMQSNRTQTRQEPLSLLLGETMALLLRRPLPLWA